MSKDLPLNEVSINKLFWGGTKVTYEIPIYQRNYAWEKEEISALIQDVYDAYSSTSNKKVYYIGTLVTYNKGNQVFEVIDGQQRLTTIRIILSVLDYVINLKVQNKLTYRARKKSDETISEMPDFFKVEDKDVGIVRGYEFAKTAINEKVPKEKLKEFVDYFINNVHIIHYQVPKDINLNHYFEVMNSRGEQLEKHEIVKANLMSGLPEYQIVISDIWNACYDMSVYVQRNFLEQEERLYGINFSQFLPTNSDDFWKLIDKRIEEKKNKEAQQPSNGKEEDCFSKRKKLAISEILNPENNLYQKVIDQTDKKDSFQSIIDFSNFLLIVLKITRMEESNFNPQDFNLDDKNLIDEFNKYATNNPKYVKLFMFNLIKARFFLDNYIVHHTKEGDTTESNPWKLQCWTSNDAPENLNGTNQDKLVHLLSMFEVSFTAKQRKNYLFYCLYYLMTQKTIIYEEYESFVENLADRFFLTIYMDQSKLNGINTPLPGSFDSTILYNRKFNNSKLPSYTPADFVKIYGDGTTFSNGIPLYIFNYLDFKIWKKYFVEAKGLKTKIKEDEEKRKAFFNSLGCRDFGLDFFNKFYFSRTRRSLEHYFPQANATGEGKIPSQEQINCLGNYAMIGSEANSAGSNWDPLIKIQHYLKDASGKIDRISVSSLKFRIMMERCEENKTWDYNSIKDHQSIMISILLN